MKHYHPSYCFSWKEGKLAKLAQQRLFWWPLAPPALLIIFCTKESLRKDLFLLRRRPRVGVERYPTKFVGHRHIIVSLLCFSFLISCFFLFLVSFFLVSNFYCHRDIIPSPNYCSQGAADVIVNLGSTTTSYCFTKIISSIIIFTIIINPQVDLVGIYQNRFCNQFFTALMFTSKHINVLL